MATGYFTTTVGANIIPEIWQKKIYLSMYQRNWMREVMTTINVPIGSDTHHFPTLGTFTAEQVTEGTALVGKNITPGQKNLVIDQQWAVPMTISRRLEIQNQFTTSFVDIMQRRAGEALANKLETDILSLYSSMSQEIVGTNLTADSILNGKQLIWEAGWPQDAPITLIVTPYQYRKMMQFSNVGNAANFGNALPVQKGAIEELYGIKIKVTGNISANSSYYNNIMVTGEYALIGIQQDVEFLINSNVDPLKLARDASASILYGYVETQDGFGVRMPTTN